MLRQHWQYKFSKESKFSTSIEEKNLIEEKDATSNSRKKTYSKVSTTKTIALMLKIDTESLSPSEPYNKTNLDNALNEIFDVYYNALIRGTFDCLYPFDKAIKAVVLLHVKVPTFLLEGHFDLSEGHIESNNQTNDHHSELTNVFTPIRP